MEYNKFTGADKRYRLYNQYRVLRTVDEGKLLPVSTFWSDSLPKTIDDAKTYFVTPTLRQFGTNKIMCTRVVWVDIDTVDWSTIYFPLKPSAVISTGRGHHLYWRSDDFMDYEFAKSVLDGMRHQYRNSIDLMAMDITRFLRLPGTYNQKTIPAKKCDWVYCETGLLYTHAQLWNMSTGEL